VGVVDGETVLAEAAEAYRAVLGDRLLAAYALGSLAHGGFSELVSDIDLGLIVSDPLQPGDGETIQAVAEVEKRKGSALHERLSVFWGTPTTLRGEQDGGRFPALDRLDLIENGRLLAGCDDARPLGRTLKVLRCARESVAEERRGQSRRVYLLAELREVARVGPDRMGEPVGADREPLVVAELEVPCWGTRFVRPGRGHRQSRRPAPAVARGAASEHRAAPGGVAARVVPAGLWGWG
jgi:hypothetical protein